jgi:hypothetical protein
MEDEENDVSMPALSSIPFVTVSGEQRSREKLRKQLRMRQLTVDR